jgi:hypothetical protein
MTLNRRSWGGGWVVLAIVQVLLPVLYVLSAGPPAD